MTDHQRAVTCRAVEAMSHRPVHLTVAYLPGTAAAANHQAQWTVHVGDRFYVAEDLDNALSGALMGEAHLKVEDDQRAAREALK